MYRGQCAAHSFKRIMVYMQQSGALDTTCCAQLSTPTSNACSAHQESLAAAYEGCSNAGGLHTRFLRSLWGRCWHMPAIRGPTALLGLLGPYTENRCAAAGGAQRVLQKSASRSWRRSSSSGGQPH